MGILAHLQARISAGASTIEIVVPDPDLGPGLYAGERVWVDGMPAVHRPFRSWVDLAERLRLRLATPRAAGEGRVRLVFTRLDPEARWEPAAGTEPTEKYGASSAYQRISKPEDPGFVLDMADALERIVLPAAPTILDLGVNTGDELALLQALRPELRTASLIGVDHSASAIAVARERFPEPRHRFVVADLTALPTIELPPIDLVLALGTLHSPGVDDRALLRHLVQQRLTPRGSIVIGIPNCSYLDGEVLHGAKMRNFSQPDLSLLVKNAAYYRRYLQQHRRRVFVTGKHTLLVTAVPGRPERDR
ncbi:MAG: class I SAM-dependent methyltransferase [Myxococcales bacterium]|nr:class I SAM-dependent methyltransferase [Myxococcales bacterium]MCB9716736.1 class I SAM-dependent methyltransferase [Myxococcales bacterium]